MIGFKALYCCLVFGIVTRGPSFLDGYAAMVRANWFKGEWENEARGDYEKYFATWDAEHYLYLVEFGYSCNVPRY